MVTIRGTDNDDTLFGTDGDDTFEGLGGSIDVFRGGKGSDTYYGHSPGQTDNLTLYANAVWYDTETGPSGVTVNLATGQGTDSYGNAERYFDISEVAGTKNSDVITGSASDNIIRPFAGNDRLDGGGGFDEVHYANDPELLGIVASLGQGTVQKKYAGGIAFTDAIANFEAIRGSMADDILTGSSGNDRFRGMKGADTIDGGDGIDTVDYLRDANASDGKNSIIANLATGTIRDGFGTIDQVSNVENVRGTAFNDSITGDSKNNVLRGNGGNDLIDGGSGTDTAEYLGNRNDYAIARNQSGSLSVTDLRAGAPEGTDTLLNIDRLKFADVTLDAALLVPWTAPTPEQVATALEAVVPGLSSPTIDALKAALAAETITFEQMIDGLIEEAQTSTVPALVIANLLGGTAPTQVHLAALTGFAQMQYEAYAARGVLNPSLGPYEALGYGFSETQGFASRYGALGAESFVLSSYQEVFGRSASPTQIAHFDSQMSYFQQIYRGAGLTPEDSLNKAKGAIIGQMMGHAILDEPDLHTIDDAANMFLRQAVVGQANYGDPL